MPPHKIKETLTSAVDKLGQKPAHLNSLVDEIGRLEFGEVAGWRWWWLGIPNPDGFGIEAHVHGSQLASLLPSLAASKFLNNLEVFPIGRPAPDVFRVTAHLAPLESGVNVRQTGQAVH